MDPLSILSSIYTAATELHAIYSQVKVNEKQCATLHERVQAIIPHVRLLEGRLREKHKQRLASDQLISLETADEVALGVQLQRLNHTLETAVALVTKKNWLGRLLSKSDYTRDFVDLNADLSTLSGDLHLGVSVSAMFDAEKDAANAEADRQHGNEAILHAIRSGQADVIAEITTIRQQLETQQGASRAIASGQQALVTGQAALRSGIAAIHLQGKSSQIAANARHAEILTRHGDLQADLHLQSEARRSEAQAIQSGQDELRAGQHNVYAGIVGIQLEVKARRNSAVAREEAREMARVETERRFRAEMLALQKQQHQEFLAAARSTASSSATSARPSRPAAHVISIDLDDLALDARPVGSGGFGDVYRAEWKSRHLTVAVKQLRVNGLTSTALAEFQAEVKLMANVPRHDHVVGLIGICVDENLRTYMLVMEWMGRGSLYQLMRDQSIDGSVPFNLHDRLSLMLQCAKALNHLHLLRPPITHGDVKSMNFLVNAHGDVKIGQSRLRCGYLRW